MKVNNKVLIIGAGLTGLLAAIELIQLGYDVKVMEQAPQLRNEGGGLGIWPPGVAILQAKFAQKIQQCSGHVQEIKVGQGNGEAVTNLPLHIFDGINGQRNIFVVRKELQEMLAQLVPAEKLYFNKKCTHVTQDQDGVQAYFADGTTLAADFLIAADGIFSKVRRSLSIDAPLRYSGVIAMGGIIPYQQWEPKYHFIMDLNRLSMLMPVGNQRYYTFMARPLAQGEIQNMYQNPQQQLDLFANRSSEVDKILSSLKEALQDEAFKEHFFCQEIYDADPMPSWSQGRVVLLGEAAHPIGPVLGLGTSFCFQGVMSLISSLKQTPQDLTKAFMRYQQIQAQRLQQFLPAERADEDNILNSDPNAFNARVALMRTADMQELFAPLIKAFSATEAELLGESYL